MSKKYTARTFQDCTVQNAIKQLFKARGTKRFLVADEVGLGKTIIANHVVDFLRKKKDYERKKKVIIYVSSSLDITKQNKGKLTEDINEIITSDRVSILFRGNKLQNGINIVSMTPGTSLDLRKTIGNKIERAYIVKIIARNFNARGIKSNLVKLFRGSCSCENFSNQLKKEVNVDDHLPKSVEKQIIRTLKKMRLEDGTRFISAISHLKNPENRSGEKKDKRINELVSKVRQEFIKGILSELSPDLVIFDEFQKFKELIDIEGKVLSHPLSRILLESSPTLLLSATPYKIFSNIKENELFGKDNDHYSGLIDTFSFLTGSRDRGICVVNEIQNYGQKLKGVSKTNVTKLLEEKTNIERNILKFMSRTERIYFEGTGVDHVTPIFLSDSRNTKITSQNILEYFKLSRYADSSVGAMSYWKSSSHSMSYLKDYELIKGAVKNSKKSGDNLEKDKSLYTSLKPDSSQNIKTRYLYKDLFNEGKNFEYLWIPPSIPYYKGLGSYSDQSVQLNTPKKGLVFSSWVEVPRMISAELGSLKDYTFKKSKKKIVIDPNAESWSNLFFPSTFLAGILTQKDLNTNIGKDLALLKKFLRQKLKKELIDRGYKINKSNGKKLKIWMLLQELEFFDNPDKWMQYKKTLKGKVRIKTVKNKDSADSFFKSGSSFFSHYRYKDSKNREMRILSPKDINQLVEIAIGSPAVCLLRAASNHLSNEASSELWQDIAAFSLSQVKSFVNKEDHQKIIDKSINRRVKPLTKTLQYFVGGNFQAVMDEYIYLACNKKTEESIKEFLVKLSYIFSPSKSRCEVKVSNSGKIKRVNNSIICCFGKGDKESNSRDANRESFNSPFWPFVLATTSVGQEGLDFHLYCNNIYHWNLPSNPVSFEQREGRLNRYDSYAIRQSIAGHEKNSNYVNSAVSIWDSIFRDALNHSSLNNRYNLGMSPNWIYTPKDKKHHKINRHILDFPCSNDRHEYDSLINGLKVYRLALGQPCQESHLNELNSNQYIQSLNDVRSLMLNFFPFESRDRKSEISKYIEGINSFSELQNLIKDTRSYHKRIADEVIKKKLKYEIDRHIKTIEKYIGGHSISKRQLVSTVEALYYFVDPYDNTHDNSPVVGFDDDLLKLRST